MFKFKIGDEVNYVITNGKYRGIVRALPSTPDRTYAVELLVHPGPTAGFNCHTCSGLIPSGLGRWASQDFLRLVNAGTWPPTNSKSRYKQFQTKVL